MAKPIDPNKEFVTRCKLLFSSLTCRSATYAYFGIAPNTIILSNSTSPAEKDKIVHGDRIMGYRVGELSYHVLYFKDELFYSKLCEWLKIPNGILFCVHTSKLCPLLKHDFDELKCTVTPEGNFIKKEFIGGVLDNFHIRKVMHATYNEIERIGTKEHRDTFSNIFKPLDIPNENISGRVFYLNIDLKELKLNDKGSIAITALDGLSCVSIKEFIKKVNKLPHSHMLYVWAMGDYFGMMTIYEDEGMRVKTIKPNFLILSSKGMPEFTKLQITI